MESQLHKGSPERFGYEWSKYSTVLPEHRTQLQRWLGSLPLESFKGKSVLDAGCGMGRNSYWFASSGATGVTAVDVDPGSLASARRNLAVFPQVTVLQKSVYDLDFRQLGLFDRVCCIGVLHHLAEPDKALARLWSCVAPGGELVLWCYGREGNEIFLPAIQAMRQVGSRLPIEMTHWLAKGLAAVSWPVLRTFPWKTEYYRNLKELSYTNIESIVFDQILPRIAHYWTEEDLRKLVSPLINQSSLQIERVQGNSWAVLIKKLTSCGE